MATTYPLIRDNFISALQAIAPAFRADLKFIVHREAVEFVEWVNANAKACWRRFEMLSNVDYELGGLTNAGGSGTIWNIQQGMTLLVAYPRELGKYGADNERDLDDAIDSDLAQLDKVIGGDGSANGNWVTGLDDCRRESVAATKTPQAVIVSCTYRLLYDRSY